MKNLISVLTILSGLFILVACQTLSKEECVVADWRVIGEQDGAAGYSPQERFGNHVRACEKAGVLPDQTLWNEGFQIGLTRFCTPLSGLAHGQKAGNYNNICPIETAAGFRTGYELGLKQKRKRDDIASIKRRINSAQSTISTSETLIEQGKIDQKEGERAIRNNRNLVNDLNRQLGREEAELDRIDDEVSNFQYNTSVQSN